MSKVRGIIFDMDDTLIRSAAVWKAAEMRMLAMMGQPWRADLDAQCKGMNALDVARIMHEHIQPDLPLADCQQAMRKFLIEGFSGDKIAPMPGAAELVNLLRGRYPMAVASGSPMAAIEMALGRFDLLGHFDHVISSESVARGKPHPDVFLLAAERLRLEPADCLVLEDSLIGCRAAQAAGMRCFVVPSTASNEFAALATRVFGSLGEIAMKDVEGLDRA